MKGSGVGGGRGGSKEEAQSGEGAQRGRKLKGANGKAVGERGRRRAYKGKRGKAKGVGKSEATI